MKKLDNIPDLMHFCVNLSPSTFEIFKNRVEIFVESSIKNEIKKDKYLKELEGISIDTWVYFASYPWDNEGEAQRNNREAEDRAFKEWTNSMAIFLLKIKGFLDSNLNKKEKTKSDSSTNKGAYYRAWGDIIIWDNNKNTINEIDKLIELLNKSWGENKTEIMLLLEEFKQTQDKNKLIDVFSILWNGASINSMIIALSNLLN